MSATVFVDWLPPHLTESDLRELCTPFGQVVSAFVVCPPGRSSAFGYASFAAPAEAAYAISALNGAEIMGHRLALSFGNAGSPRMTALPSEWVESFIAVAAVTSAIGTALFCIVWVARWLWQWAFA
jgi:RNA recognition motif-containing protein